MKDVKSQEYIHTHTKKNDNALRLKKKKKCKTNSKNQNNKNTKIKGTATNQRRLEGVEGTPKRYQIRQRYTVITIQWRKKKKEVPRLVAYLHFGGLTCLADKHIHTLPGDRTLV